MHKHPDYNGFVSTVLPRRVTLGEWEVMEHDGYYMGSVTVVLINNHRVGSLQRVEGKYHLYNDCGSKYSAYNFPELLPFIGYSSEATEF